MTSAPLPADPAAQRAFVLAGRAVFTVQNAATGGRFTYRVSRCKDDAPAEVHFVSVLTGPDNADDYSFLGTIFASGNYRPGRRSAISVAAPSAQAFSWLWDRLRFGRPLPPSVTLHHEGRCGKCGKPLTVPESITRGLGPTCAGSLA